MNLANRLGDLARLKAEQEAEEEEVEGDFEEADWPVRQREVSGFTREHKVHSSTLQSTQQDEEGEDEMEGDGMDKMEEDDGTQQHPSKQDFIVKEKCYSKAILSPSYWPV